MCHGLEGTYIIMGALPEVVGMRDRGWEESVQDMNRTVTLVSLFHDDLKLVKDYSTYLHNFDEAWWPVV